LGQPPVRAISDVSTPLFWAVKVTVTACEAIPTVVIPENVSGVVEIWAPTTGASKLNRTSGHRFHLSNMAFGEPIGEVGIAVHSSKEAVRVTHSGNSRKNVRNVGDGRVGANSSGIINLDTNGFYF
jgi:hypothetical protein